jgi:hypothetical protein
VPTNENTSRQQAATLAFFKCPRFGPFIGIQIKSGDSLGVLPFGNTPKE